MKKIIFVYLISFSFIGSMFVHAQWKTEECPVVNNLNAITVTDNGMFWIVGDTGAILFKKDSKWNKYPLGITENLYSIDFPSDLAGWAVGANGTILHFNGYTWKKFESPTNADLYTVKFQDEYNGVAAGKSGTILVYKNGKWSLVENQYRGNFNTSAYHYNNIWLGGGFECLNFPMIRINNAMGDKPEHKLDASFYATINGIHFLNPTKAWAVGNPSTILFYDGVIWNKITLEEQFSSLSDVYFSDENTGIAVGYGGSVLSFSGDKWQVDYSGTMRNLKGTVIYNKILYAVGESGTIISSGINYSSYDISEEPVNINGLNPGSITGFSEFIQKTGFSFTTHPNPCDGILNVYLSSDNLFKAGTVKITNMAGQTIYLKNEVGFNGLNYDFTLNTEQFLSGIYFININIDGKTETGNFIVAH
ncbi:MAG: T9SS type A sorting domain-containing protein [Bacteroidales bacterium]|nr:T9SS type A sorting domain-containing protein [Bacteroidales bacterium]